MSKITNDRNGIADKELFQYLKQLLHPGLEGRLKRSLDGEKARQVKKLILENLNGIADLDFLRFFPELEILFISSRILNNVAGLEHTPKLRRLEMFSYWENPVDIAPVGKCLQLEELEINIMVATPADEQRTANMRGFAALEHLQELSYLMLPGLRLRDLSWLQGLQKLEDLALTNNPLYDLSPLAKLPRLATLDLRFCDLTDISSLGEITSLQSLSLDNNRIHDFAALRKLKMLETLSAENNGLTPAEIEKWQTAFKHISEASFS